MYGYLINPETKTIEKIEVVSKNGEANYVAIKQLIDCDWIDLVSFNNGSPKSSFDLWVDDEGLFKEEQNYFYVTHPNGPAHGHRFFAGKALVLASDKEGASISPTVNFDFLKNLVIWEMQTKGKNKAEGILSKGATFIPFEPDEFDDVLQFIANSDKYSHE